MVEEGRHREGDRARPQRQAHPGEHLTGAGPLTHRIRGTVELDDGQSRNGPRGQGGADLRHGGAPGDTDDDASRVSVPTRPGGLVTLGTTGLTRTDTSTPARLGQGLDEIDHVRGGDGGDLLEAVDLRGALTHRDDMRADPEDLRHPPLQGAGTPGLDEADPHDTLLPGTGQEPGDGRARHPQVVGDHLHRLALDVVHGGRLVGAQETAGVGGTGRTPGCVSNGSASHVILLAPPGSARRRRGGSTRRLPAAGGNDPPACDIGCPVQESRPHSCADILVETSKTACTFVHTSCAFSHTQRTVVSATTQGPCERDGRQWAPEAGPRPASHPAPRSTQTGPAQPHQFRSHDT